MATGKTQQQVDESTLLFVRDNTTNDVQLVVSPKAFQVGLNSQPADFVLKGKVSLSEKDYFVNAGNSWSSTVDEHITIANISNTSAPPSGYVSITLPKSPRVGQLVIVKDFSGTSGTYPIRIYGSNGGTIDGSNYQSISINYGCIQLSWNGTSWFSVSTSSISGGGGGAPADASYVVLGINGTLTNERVLTAGSGISISDGGAGSTVTISAIGGGGGSGDVVGPSSSTDNAIVRFDLTTGKLIQNSGVLISDSDDITTPGNLEVDGGDITSTATTFNLLNSTVTALNVGGAATTIEIGAVTGTTSINNALTVDGNSTLGNAATDTTTVAGSLAVNGTAASSTNKITSTATTFNLLNSTVTTLNIGGAATTIEIGAATGTTSINNALTVDGNVTLGDSSADTITANGTTTFVGSSVTTTFDGDIAVNGGDITTTSSTFNLSNGASTLNMGTTAAARTVNLGTGAATQVVNIGSSSNSSEVNIRSGSENINIESGTGYIQIGTTGAFAGTRLVKIGSTPSMQTNVTLGSSTGTSSMQIDCGTGALEIATTASQRTCNIATGTATQYVTLGSGTGASELFLNSGTGDIRIGCTNSARRIMIGSNIDISSAYKQSIYIGAKAVLTGNYVAVCDGTSSTGHEVRIISEGAVVDPGGVHSVRIGTTPDTCLTALGSLSGSSYTHVFAGSAGMLLESKSDMIFSGSTSTSYTMGSASGAGTITLGQSTVSNTINIGNANTSTGNTQTINIGSGSPAGTGKSVITIGNTNGASSVVIQSGTGDIELNSTDSIQLQYVGPMSTSTRIETDSTGIGFFGTAPVAKQSVASDTLANLYTALRNYGLIV
ncbi:MAG: hypothetical protein EBU90_07265 [Proteobacteria bacterium]|nr:hypothetical protein [Pseudomonadota bacterium]